LIRDGAAIVDSADDIVAELGLAAVPTAAATARSTGGPASRHPAIRNPVIKVMEPGAPYDLDALAAASGLNTARLLTVILELELTGLVQRVDGGRFMRPA
jgi:DNA processing protein